VYYVNFRKSNFILNILCETNYNSLTKINVFYMSNIYHYTSFETFQKIIETKTIRLNSLKNVDDLEEGVLLDTQNQAPYTFVSCWTKKPDESIPLWSMYVESPFAIRIEISSDFLEPIFFKKYFIENHKNRNAYVFLMHRGNKGTEFLSDIVYKEQPLIQMYKNLRGMVTDEYIETYGISKRTQWNFQEEIRFVVQAVPISQIRTRSDASLYTLCQEIIINNDPTNIEYIDMEYNIDLMLTAHLMLGPSTTKQDEEILKTYINEKLPEFRGTISRSKAYIKKPIRG
jgi:hypothetical protein